MLSKMCLVNVLFIVHNKSIQARRDTGKATTVAALCINTWASKPGDIESSILIIEPQAHTTQI